MIALLLAAALTPAVPAASASVAAAPAAPSLCGAGDAKMVRYAPPAEANGPNPLFRLVASPPPAMSAAAARAVAKAMDGCRLTQIELTPQR